MTSNASSAPDPAAGGPVIFFDGVCGLCNRFVDWVLRRDRTEVFRFAPLQGETARRRLGAPPGDPLGWSVVYQDEAGTHQRSTASLRIIQRLGGVWSGLAAVALWVPAMLRDPVYAFIARHRYRWFGKRETCRIPRPRERSRFLD